MTIVTIVILLAIGQVLGLGIQIYFTWKTKQLMDEWLKKGGYKL